MISKAMNAKLTEQITAEFAASHAYLAMASVFDRMGLKILRKRFLEQSQEEREHAMEILAYVMEVGGSISLDAVAKPKADYKDARAIIQAALESEQNVTRMINDLVALADKENDYATRSFLTWFVDEQVEEVASMTDLLNLVDLADGNMLQVENRVRHEMVGAKSS